MRNFIVFALACSLLTACGVKHTMPKPIIVAKPVTVDVAIAVPCLKKIPTDKYKFLSDKDILTGSGAQQADNLWADHLERRDFGDKLLAAIQACLVPPQ